MSLNIWITIDIKIYRVNYKVIEAIRRFCYFMERPKPFSFTAIDRIVDGEFPGFLSV